VKGEGKGRGGKGGKGGSVGHEKARRFTKKRQEGREGQVWERGNLNRQVPNRLQI
jgi:hypothetical protein